MYRFIIGFAIALILIIAEYFICTKFKNPLPGGIIPFIILIGSITVFLVVKIPIRANNIFPFIVLNCIIFGEWIDGRSKYNKIQKEELDKMKAYDLTE